MSMFKEITCTVLGGLITYIVIDKFCKQPKKIEGSILHMTTGRE